MRSSLPINQIAKLAAVSPATVSRVINHRELVRPETVQKVYAIMKQLNIVPPVFTDFSDINQSRIIFLNSVPDANPFYTELLRGVRVSADSHGYELIQTTSLLRHQDIESYISLMSRVQASGLITLNYVSVDILDTLNKKVPLIQCSEYNEESNLPYVSIDDRDAARQAVRFLISTGRNKIAFINGPAKNRYARQRLEGFLDEMKLSELYTPNNWIINVPEINYDMAYASVSQLLNNDTRPNAIFAVSDVFALAAINAARRFHLNVPQNLMVVGFDNIPLCRMVRPTITTIAQPQFQLGFTACENLITQIESLGSISFSTVLGTELIVRGSARTL